MQTLARLAAAVLALCAFAAQAATPSADAKPVEAKSAQQNRMKTCSTEARFKELKGPDRKAFMSDCLKKKA
jgi:hypothetical protein